MDQDKKVTKLKWYKDTGELDEVKELFVKRNERSQLEIPAYSDSLIIHDYYILSRTRFFNLYETSPFPDGICDMEDYVEMEDLEHPEKKNKKERAGGPFRMRGSNKFIMIYNQKQQLEK